MNRSVSYYQSDEFKKLGAVNNDDSFQEFINSQLKNRSFSMNLFLIFLCVLPLVIIATFFILPSAYSSLEGFLMQVGFGIFFGLLLIPIHELLHGLYLRVLGSKNIKYEFDFRKFRFSCYSEQFVLSRREYYSFLLVPFMLITFLQFILAIGFNPVSVLFLSMMLMHVSICIGDFALVNFSSLLEEDEVFIYYDSQAKQTIFLSRNTQEMDF